MKRSPKLNNQQIEALHAFIQAGSRSGREVRRAQSVLLIDQEVRTTAITAVTGYRRRQAFELRRKYVAHGAEALKDNRKGKPKELLTKKQRAEIIEVIKTKKPSELGSYYQNYA